MKFGTEANSNMLNSMVLLTFSAIDGKHPFWALSFKKSKLLV